MCSQCEVVYINGVKCHEHGCPEAWKEKLYECKWCGCEFIPEHENQQCCSDECQTAYMAD